VRPLPSGLAFVLAFLAGFKDEIFGSMKDSNLFGREELGVGAVEQRFAGISEERTSAGIEKHNPVRPILRENSIGYCVND